MFQYFPRKTLSYTAKILQSYMDIPESESIAYMILHKVFGLNRVDIIIDEPFLPTDAQQLKYEVIINRLSNNEPIQYILKEADFFGRKFYVNPNVLIPRQETESLIELIKNYDNWHRPKIADVGTGSGCIACTLDLEINDSTVHAYDISMDAIKVATKNNSKLNSDVQFHEIDILTQNLTEEFDIIVSNPPYVTNHEKYQMRRNVLDYEPELALFVPDNDPLIFYKTIMEEAHISLRSGGALFFEINEQFGKNILLLLQHHGFEHPKIHNDINDKQRFASAVKP
ncbi:peptide chain release factor N(5)-glutamine methyltransferase [Reichenbachiella versicolor]|uniref:peptide chain release factor N(5)-glutamine methyltransferase n=1 Tax=Reichenbachiella versicolor TaxID=1821036 RepID=UPI000D6E42DB|nr:peptide chain release factor N(5)-glutamine methyltransferase [Reichenbachiella versicolor]